MYVASGGRRPGAFGDRPSGYDSGMEKSSYRGGRNDGYRAQAPAVAAPYGSYGSVLILFSLFRVQTSDMPNTHRVLLDKST